VHRLRNGRRGRAGAAATAIAVSAVLLGCEQTGCEPLSIETPDLHVKRVDGRVQGDLVATVRDGAGQPVPGLPARYGLEAPEGKQGYSIIDGRTDRDGRLLLDVGQAAVIDFYVERDVDTYRSYYAEIRALGTLAGVRYCFASARGKIIHDAPT
jgi:hypothetical protein